MSRRPREEEGAILLITVLGSVAILLMAAIVIDLSSTRTVRNKTRSAADAAATAGAFDLGSGTTAAERITARKAACATAFSYAFTNLSGNSPTSTQAGEISTKCNDATNGMGSDCAAAVVREVTYAIDGRTVNVTNPVPNNSRLLTQPTAVGGGDSQNTDPTADGNVAADICGRIGVEITQAQSRFFGGVSTSGSRTFSIHSVARYRPVIRGGPNPPSLVVLNQTECKTIDTGNGKILVGSPTTPGRAYSDSNGPSCNSGNGILHAGSSGTLQATGTSSASGELAWFSAPVDRGFTDYSTVTSPDTSHYVGRLYSRSARVTRQPADDKYHCAKLPATCARVDPVTNAEALLNVGTIPSGFTLSTLCNTKGGDVTFDRDTYVDCPDRRDNTFDVTDHALKIKTGKTVIFTGRLKVGAQGTLAVNVSETLPLTIGAGTLDAEGLPVPDNSAAQSRLIVKSSADNAIEVGTNSSALFLAQTFVYSRGGFDLSSLNTFRWSPPSSDGDGTKGLLYWSESSQDLAIQGGPSLKAAGVMFLGNGRLTSGGSGEVDLTKVQVWVNKITINGNATIKLYPDPTDSIKVTGGLSPGTSLIR